MKMPRGIRPIQPVPLVHRIREEDYLIEVKHDGYRGIYYQNHEGAEFRSKNNKPLNWFRGLELWISLHLAIRSVILDGEIVVLDDRGRSDRSQLMRHPGRAVYIAFDLLFLDGEDLRKFPLITRKARLEKLLGSHASDRRILYLEHWWNINEISEDAVNKTVLEGFVLKRKQDPYRDGVRWYKIKNPTYNTSLGTTS